eukprot:CAMPEP_0174855054 /NCGR_PEP_ID=MMETSP1114-20130205/32363_1 /TAXON_ID=312471 /ORGANISM="Neobodo designis, Strain CCAP 1951/1" /LENGTH=347 /DNA_ID=CAMNT_0016089769 /DNA_START=30 /DNA_END=1069 /DNA_ORIENTATION=-
MGQAFSYALDTAEREFVRVQGVASAEEAGRAVNYHQLRNMQLPEDLAPNTKHVAVLFSIDAGLDGVFSFDDLRNFIGWAADVMPGSAAGDDFAAQLQARCIFRLWSSVRQSPRGNDVFIDWLLLLAERAFPRHVMRPAGETGETGDVFGEDDDGDSSDTTTTDGSSGESSAPQAIDDVSQIVRDADDAVDGAAGNSTVIGIAAGDHNVASNDVEGERRRFGAAAVALVYELLQLEAVYGLDFDGFLHLLTGAAGAAPEMEAAPMDESTDDGAPSSPATTSSGGDGEEDTAGFFQPGEGTSRTTALIASFDTPREGQSDELPWVEEAPLRAFLDAFAQSMWVTLQRLG